MCKKWLVCAVACVWLGGANGCAAGDDAPGNLQCAHAELRTGWQENSMNLTSACDGSASDLVGVWESINTSYLMRYEFTADGMYAFWMMRGTKWARQYEGNYWIEYHPSMGLYRTEMHMRIPDIDDYGVRYHIVGDVLHFEEPSFDIPTLQFRKIE